MKPAGAIILLLLCISALFIYGCGEGVPKGSDPATSPPRVVIRYPLLNAANVSREALVYAYFSEALDPTTISTESFKVGSLEARITGTVTYDAALYKATFTPSSLLLPDTTYLVTVEASIKDLAGNPMEAPDTWMFSTRVAPPAPAYLSAEAQGNQVSLSWESVAQAAKYNLYWSTGATVTKEAVTSGTTFSHTGLANNTAYIYSVTAVDSFETESLNSPSVVATPEVKGILDTSFNSVGYVTKYNSGGGTTKLDSGYGLGLDSAGNIYVAGSAYSTNPIMALWKFNGNGGDSAGFGSSGIYLQDTGTYTSGSAYNVLIDPAIERLYLSGSLGISMGAVSLNMNSGALDTGYGNSGYFSKSGITEGAINLAISYGSALDVSNRVVVAGKSAKIPLVSFEAFALRIKTNGFIDTDLNSPKGYVTLEAMLPLNNDSMARNVAVDNSGKLVIVGETKNASGDKDITVWRYNANGTIDHTFNTTGYHVFADKWPAFTTNDSGNDVIIDSSNRIFVAGNAYISNPTNTDMVVIRFDPSGALDTSFNGTGYFSKANTAGGTGYSQCNGLALDSEGRIIAVGSSINPANNSDMVIWQLLSNGTLDTGFGGGNGYVIFDYTASGGGSDVARDIKIDQLGRYVVTGYGTRSITPAVTQMILWRYK